MSETKPKNEMWSSVSEKGILKDNSSYFHKWWLRKSKNWELTTSPTYDWAQ